MQFFSEFAASGRREQLLTTLFCRSVTFLLNELAYDARLALSAYRLEPLSTGFQVQIRGFSDKVPDLLRIVLEKVATLQSVPEGAYALVYDTLLRQLENASKHLMPVQRAVQLFGRFVLERNATCDELLEHLRLVKREDLDGFNRKFVERGWAEGLVCGNFSCDGAKAVFGPAGFGALPVQQRLERVPVGRVVVPRAPLKIAWSNVDEEKNGAVVLVALLPVEREEVALLTLVERIVGHRFFDELRTQQQLGYIVQASAYAAAETLAGIQFCVQSERDPNEVLSRVSEFVESAFGSLADVEQAVLDSTAKAVVEELLETPKRLADEVSLLWPAVSSRTFDFALRERQAARLQGLDRAGFEAFARRLAAAHRHVVQVFPAGSTLPADALTSTAAIDAEREGCERISPPDAVQ